MNAPRCSRCRRRIVRRAPRSGRLERVLQHLRVVPFRCQLCRHRFLALRLGAAEAGGAADRREYDRVALTLPASVTFHQARASGSVTSLSLGGAQIATALEPPVGALVQLEIEVMGGRPTDLGAPTWPPDPHRSAVPGGAVARLDHPWRGSGPEIIAIDGALVRSVRRGAIGVQFVWARMEPKERLREIVLHALGHEDIDDALVVASGSGLRSPFRLTDLWLRLSRS